MGHTAPQRRLWSHQPTSNFVMSCEHRGEAGEDWQRLLISSSSLKEPQSRGNLILTSRNGQCREMKREALANSVRPLFEVGRDLRPVLQYTYYRAHWRTTLQILSLFSIPGLRSLPPFQSAFLKPQFERNERFLYGPSGSPPRSLSVSIAEAKLPNAILDEQKQCCRTASRAVRIASGGKVLDD